MSSRAAPEYPVVPLTYPAPVNGLMVLSRRISLTPRQAYRQRATLLSTPPLPDPASARHARYLPCTSVASSEEVKGFMAQLLDAKRLSNIRRSLEIREDREARTLYYLGQPFVRKDACSGMLSCVLSANGEGSVFIVRADVERFRQALGLREFLDALLAEFQVSEEDVLVTNTRYRIPSSADVPDALDARHGQRRWDEEADATPSNLAVLAEYRPGEGPLVRVPLPHAPEAAKVLFSARQFVRRRLVRPEPLAAVTAELTRTLRRSFMDVDLAHLAARGSTRGSRFTFADYNQVVVHAALYRQVFAENALALPLLHSFLQELPAVQRWARTAHQRNKAATGFYGLRRSLLVLGASKADWKLLSTLPAATLKRLLSGDMPQDNERLAQGLVYVKLMRELGFDALPTRAALALTRELQHPPGALFGREGPQPAFQRLRHVYVQAMRERFGVGPAAQRRLSKKAKGQAWRALYAHLGAGPTRALWSQVCDWHEQEGAAQGFPRHNSTWASLLERSEVWHRDIGERNARRAAEEAAQRDADMQVLYARHRNPNGEGWHPWLSACAIGEVQVTPLHTGDMLAQEGSDQHHCVYGYTDYCWQGFSLIFGLQDAHDPQVRSTLELRRTLKKTAGGDVDTWKVAQLRAVCNRDPEEHHAQAAKEVARRVTRAWREGHPAEPATQEELAQAL